MCMLRLEYRKFAPIITQLFSRTHYAMSWSQTYSYTALLALDRFGAAVIFGQPDISISSLCWVYCQGASSQRSAFKLADWQISILQFLGPLLNRIQTNHMQLARMTDIKAAQDRIAKLS